MLMSKKFWKTVKPFFSNKGINANNMMLVENGEIVNNSRHHKLGRNNSKHQE